jgi:hypothetical protein
MSSVGEMFYEGRLEIYWLVQKWRYNWANGVRRPCGGYAPPPNLRCSGGGKAMMLSDVKKLEVT